MNDTPRRGPIARFFVGLWDAMNFTRRLVFNLLFFALLLLILAAIGAGDRTQPLLDRTTLVIAPEGALVEQYTSDPASRAFARAMGSDAGEVQLRDLLQALDAAADDDRIDRVLLRLDGLGGGGMASRRELAAAVARLRESGKQVVAASEMMGQGQYLIAAQADGQFVVDALIPIADFNERFGADFPDDEYDTVGGLVTAAIGHLPETGEELTLGRFLFRVARADARRVHAFHVGVLADA